jgi:hypothetical protein
LECHPVEGEANEHKHDHQRELVGSNSHFENLKCEFRTLQSAKLTFQVQC